MNRLVKLFILIILFSIQNWSCTTGADPDNLEPEIIIQDATDITRNEATISVRILTKGIGKLSYINFFYGEGENCNNRTEPISPDSEVVSFRLKNLKSGTTYSFCAQGGTSTATIKTKLLKFTTNPNERPVVTGAVPITTGPVGIIVEFEILEDGGDPVKIAGCDVTDNSSNNTERRYVTNSNINTGKIRLLISGLTPLTDYTIVPFATNSIGESKGASISFTTQNSIIIKSAGTLSEIFDNKEITLETLTISGEMNGDDFRFLRRILKAPVMTGEEEIKSEVSNVNIADVEIVEGGSTYDGSRFTENNIISTGMFADCSGLQAITLPLLSEKIGHDAFRGCTKLRVLTIPANISELQPSTGCNALEKIEVSDVNPNFKSIDGVLFNRDASEILWFPLGKSGDYKLPQSVTAIGENAFRGTHITSLIIPSGVKTISRGAFSGSALIEITLPDIMTNISEGIFQDCSALKNVYFGKATEYLGNYIFDGCKIENIYIGASIPPVVSANSFSNKTSDIFSSCTLHVPEGAKKQYQNHAQWGKFKTIVEIK